MPEPFVVESIVAAHDRYYALASDHTARSIAMKMDGKLYWDPVRERFADNDRANAMLERPQRYPYGTNFVR